MKPKNLILPAALILSLPAHGAITYVDAVSGTGGNTRATGGLQSDTSWLLDNISSTDADQWSLRTSSDPGNPFGTNNTIFQAMPNGTPAAIPQLTTTISSLTDGETYKVWAFFQDNVGDTSSPYQNWVISAGLTTSLDTTYWAPGQPLASHNSATPVLGTGGTGTITTTNVSEAEVLTYSGTPPIFTEGSGEGLRSLFAVYLGEVTLSGGTEINVYVDMLIAGSSGATRVWYDGVGYELIPEPSTAILGGLGLLALLRRRRN
jgi:hypothetical protein